MSLIVAIAFGVVFAEFIVGFYILAFVVGLALVFISWVSNLHGVALQDACIIGGIVAGTVAILWGSTAWEERRRARKP
jgi:hypothetical protein